MKHVQACLSVSEDGESSFHYCGSPVSLVQPCLWAGNTLQPHFFFFFFYYFFFIIIVYARSKGYIK